MNLNHREKCDLQRKGYIKTNILYSLQMSCRDTDNEVKKYEIRKIKEENGKNKNKQKRGEEKKVVSGVLYEKRW